MNPSSVIYLSSAATINHLQDCGEDYHAIGRVYLPVDALAAHGASASDLAAPAASPELRATIVDLTQRTRLLLRRSAGFAAMIRDRRLSAEVAIIQRLAESLAFRLLANDPLSETVHHGKAEAALLAGRAVLGNFFARRA